MKLISSRNSQWMKAILLVAGLYHIIWGSSVIIFPEFWFRLADLELPRYIQLWQCFGVYAISMGVGYLIAYTNPQRHWPIVMMGLVAKIMTPLGFIYYYFKGDLPLVILQMCITNDMVWWLPFGLLLYNVYIHEYLLDKEIIRHTAQNIKELLSWHYTNKDEILLDLSHEQPILLVFLRHFGCTFCRETLCDVSQNRAWIESQGVKIVLVHQLPEHEAKEYFQRYNLTDIDSVSDPELLLYKGFRLKRGRISQIFGWKDIHKLFFSGNLIKLGIANFREEDPFQMPGVFLIKDGEVINSFIHHSVSDTVPYKELIENANHFSLGN